MAKEEFAKAFGWDDLCLEGCYHPYDHSHNFTLGKDIKRACSVCKTEMKPNAQRFGHEFRQNTAILDNFYQCPKCEEIDYVILYDGKPIAYDSIRLIALKNLESIETV